MTESFVDSQQLYAIISLIVFAIIFVAFVVFFLNVYVPFKERRRYIKMEIKRSFEQQERLYWKKELKRLYLSHIPFVGRFFW